MASFIQNLMKERLDSMQKPMIYNKVKLSYDAAIYALLKYAETLPITTAADPAVGLDFDFGTLLNDTLAAQPDLEKAFKEAFEGLGEEFTNTLMFEKVNCLTRQYNCDETGCTMEGAYDLLENARMDNVEYQIQGNMASSVFFGKEASGLRYIDPRP